MQLPVHRSEFLLDENIHFLNFGSFGACPRPVFDDYQQWQRELEREPVQFIAVKGPERLAAARASLAEYVNCEPSDVVFVTNPSYAVNVIARGLALKEGDEILTTDLEYGACDMAWQFYAAQAGARVVRQPVTLPLVSRDQLVEEFMAGVTERTRIIFISHITSSTALVLPAEEICRKARERGIFVMIDGAHAPAQVPLNLRTLDADAYTGACHKWMMAPKGSSFLHLQQQHHANFPPLVISWGFEDAGHPGQFVNWHQGQGTRDFSAFLAVPAAISFMRERGWWEIAKACRELVREFAPRLCELLGTSPLCTLSDEFLGQMFSARIASPDPEGLQRTLFSEYKVEVPVMRHARGTFLRYSVNAFNGRGDLEALMVALEELKAKGTLLSPGVQSATG